MRALPAGVRACLILLPLLLTGPAAAESSARDTLAGLEKDTAGPKERMRALVSLVKTGGDAVPALVEALQKASAPNRAFAAYVLGIIADPSARPALEKALGDPEQEVRSQALLALRMLGPLKLTDQQRQALQKSNFHVRAHLEHSLARDDDPNPKALRKALLDYDPAQIDTARMGQLAPDFTLPDLTGKTFRLSQRGPKPVVLVFLVVDH